MKYIVSLCFVLNFLIVNNSYAQLSDLAKIDYTNISGNNSDIEYNRIRVLFNYPIKLKKEGTYLFLGIDYSNIDLIMEDNISFENGELEDFQIIDFNIGYTTPLKNDWRLGARLTPGFSSNLTAKKLGIDDVVISSDIVFIKDHTKQLNGKKPWRLIVGMSYSENRGFSFPLPFISYYKKFHDKWSYNLGVPKTNLQFHFSKQHKLKLYAEIDGFTSNLQRGILINNSSTAKSINMSLILSGLQYEFNISKYIKFYARSAYIMDNNVQLRDHKKDNIITLDNSNTLYIRTGLKLKI